MVGRDLRETREFGGEKGCRIDPVPNPARHGPRYGDECGGRARQPRHHRGSEKLAGLDEPVVFEAVDEATRRTVMMEGGADQDSSIEHELRTLAEISPTSQTQRPAELSGARKTKHGETVRTAWDRFA